MKTPTEKFIEDLRELAVDTGLPAGVGAWLDEAADRLEKAGAATLVRVEPAPLPDAGGALGAAGRRGAIRALRGVLNELDGWVAGAKENHEALGHRGERVGEECWNGFHPADFRSMVNDAARALSLPEMSKKEGGE